MRSRCISLLLVALTAGCGGSARSPATRPTPASGVSPSGPSPTSTPAPTATGVATRLPILPPARALLVGLMPLHSAGVDDFRAKHPTYDGRGVLIGILDTGVDPGVDGLIVTSTGAPKMLDVRDFSGEGVVRLAPVTPTGDGTVSIAGRALSGAGRIGRLTTATTWYAGVLAERPLGKVPGADLNGDGTNSDAFPVIVVKATDGWVAFIDTNLDGSFEDEMPLHDYRQGRETIALGTKPITLAANFGESSGVPTLAVVFDNNAHGTHVAGIAAGHTLFNVAGFDGVAPGAQLLGLKIADDARGGISMTGSIQHAMEYAARYVEQRHLPLVLNLSWGIGNEPGERAVIDSIVNAFLVAHPEVVFTISAGNDGPGLSTVGLPGSADLAVSVGATLPGIYVPLEQDGAPPVAGDFVGSFSGRGGRFGKPDLLAPGWAFSTVPSFDTGNEIKAGTSMSAPYVAGLAACLMSALAQEGRTPDGAEVSAALRVGAAGLPGASVLDQGAGVPQLERAYRWLLAGHQGSAYVVRATTGGGSAAFRRDGLAGPLFRLVNVVTVPYNLSDNPLFDERRSVGPGQVRRYFLRVAPAGATLVATVTLADSGQQTAKAILYEPNGAPFRELARDSIVPIGGSQVGTARFVVRAEDALAGVYELDVVAPPRSGAVANVRAQLAPLTLADREATNPGPASVSGRVTQTLLGAERALEIAGRGAPPESITVSVPDWAATAVVEVEVPREQWREFPDFGVTEFDSTGQQVSQGPLEYAFGRQAFAVPPALLGHPLTVELYPGFARDKGVHPWRATVRVRFLLREPRQLGDGREITVLPGGRAPLPAQRPRDLALPEGFPPLVEVSVRASVGPPPPASAPDATRRVVVSP